MSLCTISLLALLMVLPGPSFARAVRPPRTAAPQGWASLIVTLDGALTPSRAARLRSLHADPYRHLPLIDAVAVRVPRRNRARLAALPFVRHLSADGTVRKCDEFTVNSSKAAVAWQPPYNLSGQGVTVAVVDSGVRASADFGLRLVAAVDFVAGTLTPDDQCGHGTHVAGIVAGNGTASWGPLYFHTFYGIARQAGIVNVRVLDGQGQGDVSTVVAGIQWVVSNKDRYNVRVLNLSLGHPVGESYQTDPLCQAVEAAWKAGIVVVCAAGNGGRASGSTQTPGLDNEGYGTNYGSVQSPANDPYIITVGATKSTDGNRADDRIATYSSRGPSRLDLVLKPDLVAPGNRVISTLALASYLDTAYSGTNQIPWYSYSLVPLPLSSLTYFRLSGTSMASPVVAGAVALLLQKDPTLTPDTVKARLMISADKWAQPDGTADPCTFGAGYLDIPAALGCTAVATQYAMSPTLAQDGQGNIYINLDDTFWGTRAVWGTGITDLRAIWGSLALADNSSNRLSDSQAIWGKGRTTWADTTTWTDNSDAVDLSAIAISGEN